MAANLRDERGHPIQLTDELGRPVQLTDEHGNPLNLSGVAYTTSDQTAYSAPPHTTTHHTHTTSPHTHTSAPTTSPYTHTATGGAAGTLGAALHEGGTLGEVLQAEGGDFGGGGGGQYQPRREVGGPGGVGVGVGEGGGHYQPRREIGDIGVGEGGGGQHQPRREIGEEPAIAALGGTGRSAEIQSTGYSPTSSEGEYQEGIVEGHEVEGGTRKKKGFTEKIKEKFTGGGKHKDKDKDKDVRHTATTTATTTTEVTTATTVEHHEDDGNKKGVMGKIMDKLPGTHH